GAQRVRRGLGPAGEVAHAEAQERRLVEEVALDALARRAVEGAHHAAPEAEVEAEERSPDAPAPVVEAEIAGLELLGEVRARQGAVRDRLGDPLAQHRIDPRGLADEQR